MCMAPGRDSVRAAIETRGAKRWAGPALGKAVALGVCFTNVRIWRTADGRSRRKAAVADRGSERRGWAESAPPEVVSARTGFPVIAVVPRRARRTLHRNVEKVLKSATHFALTSIVQARRMSRRCRREANGSSSAVGSVLATVHRLALRRAPSKGPTILPCRERGQPANQGRTTLPRLERPVRATTALALTQ